VSRARSRSASGGALARAALAAIVAIAGWTARALADGQEAGWAAGPVQSAPAVPSTGAMLVRVVLALALVLGLLWAVLFLYRKASRGGSASARAPEIEVLAQRSLGPRTSLAMVRVAGESLLIGITPQQVTALGRLEGGASGGAMDPALAPASSAAAPAPEAPVRFETALQGEIGRVGARLAALRWGAPAGGAAPRRPMRRDAVHEWEE